MAIITIVFSFCFTSCNEEDPYVDITAVTSISPDLLQFVTPTVTITGINGETQSFVLSASDFKESYEGGSIQINVTVDGITNSSSSTAVNNIATSTKRFDGVTAISGEIEVSYSIKDNINLDKNSYIFFHSIGYEHKIMNKDGFSVSEKGAFIKPIANEVTKDEVINYITKLSSETDKTSFDVSLTTSK